MSTTLIITFIGMLAIAATGFLSRRRPASTLEEWTVAGRHFGAFTMWFLQAGEVYTTFTFLGVSGLAFAGGAGVFYAIPYIPLALIVAYFTGPRIWRLGKERGYLTEADFFEDRFRSKLLSYVVAVLGVVFLIPYLQLQVTGLGDIVQIATGNSTSGVLSMVIAFVLTIGFVLWAGIRSTAFTSYFKDALMLVMLFVLAIAVPAYFSGSIPGMFQQLAHKLPGQLYLHGGPYNQWFFLSSLGISFVGGFYTLPHTWPVLLSAKSEDVLRRNYTFLPLYQIGLMLPMIVGFTGLVVLSGQHVNSNAILLNLTAKALPTWVLGLTVVAGIATAMVPAAGLLLGITSTFSRNIVRSSNPRTTFAVNQVAVIVATAVALFFAIFTPTLLANLLLLTFSGLAQLAPGVIAGTYLEARRPRALTLLAGIVTGEAVVAWLSLAKVPTAGVSPGMIGLVANLVVLVGAELVVRIVFSPAAPARDLTVAGSTPVDVSMAPTTTAGE